MGGPPNILATQSCFVCKSAGRKDEDRALHFWWSNSESRSRLRAISKGLRSRV